MARAHLIADLTDELLWELLDAAPDIAANLGIDDVAGRALAPDRLPDFSPEGELNRQGFLTQWWAHCGARVDVPDTDIDAVTAEVLAHVVDDGAYSVFPGRRAQAFVSTPWPVTHLHGPHVTLTTLLARDHAIGNADDADAFLNRLAGFPAALDGTVELLRVRAGQGIRAPSFTLEKSLADIAQFLTADPDDNLLVRALATRAKAAGLASSIIADRCAQAQRLLRQDVYPAYERLVDELHRALAADEPRGSRTRSAGVRDLPDGADYYRSRLRTHATVDLSPESVHEIGLQELADVQDRIRRHAVAMGVRARSMPELFAGIDRLSPSPAAAADEQVLERMRGLIAHSRNTYRGLFSHWPDSEVNVTAISPMLEDSIHSHYVPADSRGLRTAAFHVNLPHVAGIGDADLGVLCHHEVFPGHHVHLEHVQQDQRLPAFRRAMLFAGALEGWAKYAESFPARYAPQPDARTVLAGLRSELYSTANLVLDTGLHWYGWTRQQARDFFTSETAASPTLARMVSDRSAVTPGQLCAYKLGMMCVVELADRFAGSPETARRFHDAFLGLGAVPLPLLKREVERACGTG